MKYLLIDSRGRIAGRVAHGHSVEPVLIGAPPPAAVPSTRVRVRPELLALRVDDASVSRLADETDAQLVEPRWYADSPLLARALALVRNRERLRFDPTDGYPIDFDDAGVVGHGVNGPIFPRIDPAVIGLVELVGESQILLARNARRPQYYSLIAGYVEPGESCEAAFIREVGEETGRAIHRLSYQGSQPWPASGSLMVGFHAYTADVEPTRPTDGELSETVWLGAEDLSNRTVPLPPPGSIAYRLIDRWVRAQGGTLRD